MKKLMYSLLVLMSISLVACFDTKEEVTINENGTGIFTTTNDLGPVIAIAKQFGGKDAEKMNEVKIDTSISLATQVDSIANLSAEEKEMMKSGTMNIKMNLKEDKALISMNFPFQKTSDIPKYSQLSAKLMGEAMKEQLSAQAGDKAAPLNDMPEQSSFDNYYNTTLSNGLIVKTLNKEKYAGVESDEYLKGLKEAGSMGITVSTTQVYKLPRPAKKAEGKNVKLSDDKKTVTIKADIDDFYDEPSKLEYRIEY